MKYTLIIMLAIAGAWAQNAQDMTDSMNEEYNKMKQEEADAQNEAAMIKFEQDMRDAVLAHQTSIKHVQVGSFNMLVQDNCNFVPPDKPPVITVTEKECYKANFNGATTADLIAKATPLNPPSIDMVIRAVNSCELEISWIKEFEITSICYTENMPAEYLKIVKPIEDDLIRQGYVHENGKWIKRGEVKNIKINEEGNAVAMT